MSSYEVILSEDAEADLQEYIDYILFDCQAPLTALRHYEAFFNVLNSLRHKPESRIIQIGKFFLRYGTNVRRVNYKKMTIIYTVHGAVVYIHRILASKLITDI